MTVKCKLDQDVQEISRVSQLLLTTIRHVFKYAGSCCPGLFARWGMRLWGKTHRPNWRQWEHNIIRTARRESVNVDSENVALYFWGSGRQKILLLPGWNSRASHFRNYIEQLSSLGYQVIGLDPVGHGHSSGKWASLRQYLSAIEMISKQHGPFHAVIGHSFGGFCIPYSLHHYGLATKAVLLASPVSLEWLFDRFTTILQAPASVRLQMRHRVEQLLGENCWQEHRITEQASRLDHIPALIIHDADDPGVPLSHAREIQAGWHGSRLLVTEKLGHHRVLRHPTAIKPVIRFLQA